MTFWLSGDRSLSFGLLVSSSVRKNMQPNLVERHNMSYTGGGGGGGGGGRGHLLSLYLVRHL